MSFTCIKHSWRHLLKECPTCFEFNNYGEDAERDRLAEEYAHAIIPFARDEWRMIYLAFKSGFNARPVCSVKDASAEFELKLKVAEYLIKENMGSSLDEIMKWDSMQEKIATFKEKS